MALISYYDTGFATVANGLRDITGTGTQWLSSLRENDVFVGKDGRTARIGAVLSNTSLRLARNWPGDSQTSDVYEVRITPAPSEITASVRELLEKLRQGLWLTPNATGTLAERAAYDSARRGFIYMRTDVNPFLVYVKTTDATGAWSDGYAPQAGPVGPYREITAGTVTTLAPDAPATVEFVEAGDTATANFGIPAGAGFYFEGAYDSGTTYSKGSVVTQGGSAFIALQDTLGNAPSATVDTAFWARLAVKGLDGDGAGDVVGPASSGDNRIALFDGTTGKLLKDSGLTVDEVGAGDMLADTYDPTGQERDVFAAIGEIGKGVSRHPSQISTDGIWYQWTSPLAVQSNGILFTGSISRNGEVTISALNQSTGVVTTHIVASGFTGDDHSAPSILVRSSDNRIIVFYSTHSDNLLRWKISTNPLDISTFGAENTLAATNSVSYPQVVQLSAESGRIYVFFRQSAALDNRQWQFVYSDNGGATFGNRTTLRNNFYSHTSGILNPYTTIYSDGVSRIDFATMNYEQIAAGGTPNSIYHFYYESGEFFRSDGALITNIAGLPITSAAQVTTVSSDDDLTLWDIYRDDSGNIAIVWVKFEDYDTNHIYYYARWNGSAWSVNPIVSGGGPVSNNDGREWYSGGVAINKRDLNEVYASIQGGYGQFSVSKWNTSDGGASWSRATQYGGDPFRKNFRPISPQFVDPDGVELLFVAGAYQDLRDYGPVSLMAYPGPPERRVLPKGFRGAMVNKTSAQAISASTATVAFQQALYDTDKLWNGADGFVVPAGVQMVRVSGAVRLSANANSGFLTFQKNGANFSGSTMSRSSTADFDVTSAAVFVEPGDVFVLRCSSGGSSMNINAHEGTWFSIEVIE